MSTPTQRQRQLAAAGYLWILSFAVFWKHKGDPFVASHSQQGMLLSVLSILALFLPLDMLVIAAELLITFLAIFGFYRAIIGESFILVPVWWSRAPGQVLETVVLEATPLGEPTRVEQERSVAAYLPFVSLWLLHQGEVSPYVRLHCVYSIGIQVAMVGCGIVLSLPALVVLVFGIMLSSFGITQVIAGKADLFPGSNIYARKYEEIGAWWCAAKAHVRITTDTVLRALGGRRPQEGFTQVYSRLYQSYTEERLAVESVIRAAGETLWWGPYAAYILGPVVVLFQKHPLLVHHVLHGTVVLLLLVLAVIFDHGSLLYGGAMLWWWLVLQVQANKVTLLPGILPLERSLLSTLFPPRHE